MQQQEQQAAASQQPSYPPPAMAVGADPPATPPQQFLQTALVDPSGEGLQAAGWHGRCACCLALLQLLPLAGLGCPAACSSACALRPIANARCCLSPMRAAALHNWLPLVLPADPTKVYLTQPLDSSQQREDAPKFPAPLV